jgi:CO dehydrogenase nickel-insertion accessory protein CooC1
MKIAITGKGEVGKTTVTALLAHKLKTSDRNVLAIDTGPGPTPI